MLHQKYKRPKKKTKTDVIKIELRTSSLKKFSATLGQVKCTLAVCPRTPTLRCSFKWGKKEDTLIQRIYTFLVMNTNQLSCGKEQTMAMSSMDQPKYTMLKQRGRCSNLWVNRFHRYGILGKAQPQWLQTDACLHGARVGLTTKGQQGEIRRDGTLTYLGCAGAYISIWIYWTHNTKMDIFLTVYKLPW